MFSELTNVLILKVIKTEVLLCINMQSKVVEVSLGPLPKMIEIQLKDKPKTKEQLFLNKYFCVSVCVSICVNVDACRPWTCLEPAVPEEMSDPRKLDYV